MAKSSSSTNNKKSSIMNSVPSTCVIVQGTVIDGDFRSPSDTRLDGIINGNVNCDARIFMGVKSEIEGNVTTRQAVIAGKFKGDLKVSEILSLEGTAIVDGVVSADKLEVADGAILNGTVLIGESEKGNSKGGHNK